MFELQVAARSDAAAEYEAADAAAREERAEKIAKRIEGVRRRRADLQVHGQQVKSIVRHTNSILCKTQMNDAE